MRKLTLLFAILFSLHLAAESGKGVIYVVPNGTGTGASWTDALGNIQDAITLAKTQDPEARKDVWVAAGEFEISTAIILIDSVNVYGSFVGTETSLSERAKVNGGRAWEFENPTVLKGKGARLVETAAAFDMETVVDGFIMTDGNGVGSSTTGSGGAAALRPNVVLQNCIVKNNASNKAGGGVFMYPGGTVRHCLIKDNTHTVGGNGGGGIFCNTSDLGYQAYIENCVITGNNSTIRGAGINVQGGSMTYIANCEIFNNVAYNETASPKFRPGGGIYANSANNRITNCLVYNNTGATAVYSNGGNLYNNTIVKNIGGVYFAGNTITAINNLVWGCATDATGETPTSITGVNNTTWVVKNNATYNPIPTDKGWTTEENIRFSSNVSNGDVPDSDPETVGSGPKFVKVSNFIGAAQTEQEKAYLDSVDWSLTTFSPVVNEGMAVEAVVEDITGLHRPQGFPVAEAKYDIGAYELPYHLVVAGEPESAKGSILSSLGVPLSENYTFGYAHGTDLELIFVPETEKPIYRAYYTISNDGGLTFKGEQVDFTAEIDFSESPGMGSWKTVVNKSFKITVLWEDPSSVASLKDTPINCFAVDNGIQIKGVKRGDLIRVYNFSGMLVHQSLANANDVFVKAERGAYIVRLAEGVQKVLVK